jgi:hypothetical protein
VSVILNLGLQCLAHWSYKNHNKQPNSLSLPPSLSQDLSINRESHIAATHPSLRHRIFLGVCFPTTLSPILFLVNTKWVTPRLFFSLLLSLLLCFSPPPMSLRPLKPVSFFLSSVKYVPSISKHHYYFHVFFRIYLSTYVFEMHNFP